MYKDTYLRKIKSPQGRDLKFLYKNNCLIGIKQGELNLLEIAYKGGVVSWMRINDKEYRFTYKSYSIERLPCALGERRVTIEKVFLKQIKPELEQPIEYTYNKRGYLIKIKQGRFSEKLELQEETLKDRIEYLKKEAQLNKLGTKVGFRAKEDGRLIKDAQFKYTYPAPYTVELKAGALSTTYYYNHQLGVFKIRPQGEKELGMYYYRRYDVPYSGKLRKVKLGDREILFILQG